MDFVVGDDHTLGLFFVDHGVRCVAKNIGNVSQNVLALRIRRRRRSGEHVTNVVLLPPRLAWLRWASVLVVFTRGTASAARAFATFRSWFDVVRFLFAGVGFLIVTALRSAVT
jgi:hypothetical protein